MLQQKSYSNKSGAGALYLVPTPIGNLEDMTFRAIRILKEADIIAAEDTRQTRKICTHFGIDTKLVSYHEHNKEKSGDKLISDILSGKTVALVSDAGMPAISDPGYEIVRSCLDEEIAVIPLPGANAALTALVASGIPTDHFYFYGFLARHKKEKKKQLEELKKVTVPLIFYEAPHRLEDTLKLMKESFGSRQISICRELTKKFEEFIRGTLDDAIEWCEKGSVKGEFCLVIEGASILEDDDSSWWSSLTVEEHLEHYISNNIDSKEAIKKVAKERGIPKREVYAIYHT